MGERFYLLLVAICLLADAISNSIMSQRLRRHTDELTRLLEDIYGERLASLLADRHPERPEERPEGWNGDGR
jgi:hypothetical protein